jgi:replication factor C subunit 2/4
MTTAAQQALRRTMEIYSSTTRFALACNLSSKLIEAIQSRCAILRYTRLTDQQVCQRLNEIAVAEKLECMDEGIEALIFTAEGDMRNAINSMQATSAGFGAVNSENVFKVCDQPHPLTVKEMMISCKEGNIDNARKHLVTLWDAGYAAIDIVQTMFKVTKNLDLSEALKLTFLREIGFVHMRMTEGLTTQLQLAGLLGLLCTTATAQAPK